MRNTQRLWTCAVGFLLCGGGPKRATAFLTTLEATVRQNRGTFIGTETCAGKGARAKSWALHFDLMSKVESFLVDAVFSTTDSSTGNTQETNTVDPREELALFPSLESSTSRQELQNAKQSLENFLWLWARQLQQDPKAAGLATPILATSFQPPRAKTNENDDKTKDDPIGAAIRRYKEQQEKQLQLKLQNGGTNLGESEPLQPEEEEEDVQAHSMKLIFRPPKRYLSYKEQKGMEKGVLPDKKGAKVDAWSPGGIELIVSMVVVGADGDNDIAAGDDSSKCHNNNVNNKNHDNSQQHYHLQLQALRCGIDEDTIIKYTSERAIIRRLQNEALPIWKKVRQM